MAIDGASGIPDFSGSPSVWYDENGRPVLYRSLCTSSSPLSDFRNILVHSGSLNALQTLIWIECNPLEKKLTTNTFFADRRNACGRG